LIAPAQSLPRLPEGGFCKADSKLREARLLRNLFWTFAGLVILGAAALSAAVARGDGSFGIARFWERLAGPADLGPVDFTAIRRSATGNDALFCPASLCGSVPVDGVAPVFAVPAARLREAVRLIEASEADVTALARDDAQDRYLARTALMRFPDTINVRFIDLGERSTLALHSRSQLGSKDLGVNRARLEGWIRQLRDKLPVAPS
jgi:uncharacterized protein (DUF1499 family)